MFDLKKKTHYGLELMIFLAKHFGKGPMVLKDIAREKKLPYKFLEQIVAPLRQAGLLGAKEGKGGGYFLNKDPKEIAVAEIVGILEGPVTVGRCNSCPIAQICGQKDYWSQVGDKVKKALEGKTLADLI